MGFVYINEHGVNPSMRNICLPHCVTYELQHTNTCNKKNEFIQLISYDHFIMNWWHVSVKCHVDVDKDKLLRCHSKSLTMRYKCAMWLQFHHIFTMQFKEHSQQAKLKITLASHHPHPHLFSWPMCWFYCILWIEDICDDLGKIYCDFLMSNVEVFCWIIYICTHKIEIISCQILVVRVSLPFL